MADTPLAPKAEPLSDASSRNGSPHPTPGASSEPLSSEDEVTDRCYGFLLLHYPDTLPADVDTISILLIYQRRPHGLPPYWGFPKGHPEPEDRTEWESASRELLEETGLEPERVKPITPSGFSPPLPDSVAGLKPDCMSIVSQYPSSGGGIKEVTYFLARTAELERLSEQVEELVECRWVTLTEAAELIDAKPVRRVLQKLIGFASSGQGTLSDSDYLKGIRLKEVDSLDENALPKQWRTVGFCTPE
jgi:8-oxo-dGTP pyrophosphatase MutT (NUDIX family)